MDMGQNDDCLTIDNVDASNDQLKDEVQDVIDMINLLNDNIEHSTAFQSINFENENASNKVDKLWKAMKRNRQNFQSDSEINCDEEVYEVLDFDNPQPSTSRHGRVRRAFDNLHLSTFRRGRRSRSRFNNSQPSTQEGNQVLFPHEHELNGVFTSELTDLLNSTLQIKRNYSEMIGNEAKHERSLHKAERSKFEDFCQMFENTCSTDKKIRMDVKFQPPRYHPYFD